MFLMNTLQSFAFTKLTQYRAKSRYYSILEYLEVLYEATWIIWFKRAIRHLPFSPLISPPATISGKIGAYFIPIPLWPYNVEPNKTIDTRDTQHRLEMLQRLLSAAAQLLFMYYFKYIIHPHKLYTLAKCQEGLEKLISLTYYERCINVE